MKENIGNEPRRGSWLAVASVFLFTLPALLTLVGLLLWWQWQPVPVDDRAELSKIKALMTEAERHFDAYNVAENGGDEDRRKAAILAARTALEQVITAVDSLRREPYADPRSDEFKDGYVFLENFQSQAGQRLHDIVRRCRIDDFEESPSTKDF